MRIRRASIAASQRIRRSAGADANAVFAPRFGESAFQTAIRQPGARCRAFINFLHLPAINCASLRPAPRRPRPSSRTCSGICPAAWVEQLRHGSNARMPASRRLSIAFGNLRARDVVLGDLGHGPVHRQVVLAGGDDQVDLSDQAVLVHLVVVEQRAARRLADADAFQLVDPGVGAESVREQVGIVEQSARCARCRPGSRSAGRSGRGTTTSTAPLAVAGTRRVPRRPAGVPMRCADVEPRQRADAVDAVGIAERLVVRRLQVRVGSTASPMYSLVVARDRSGRRRSLPLRRRSAAGRRSAPSCRPARPGP